MSTKWKTGEGSLGTWGKFSFHNGNMRPPRNRAAAAKCISCSENTSSELSVEFFFTAPCLEFIDSSRSLSLLSFCALFRPIRRLCDAVPSWFLAAMHEHKIAHKYYYYFLESASCTTDRQDRFRLSWKFRIFLR